MVNGGVVRVDKETLVMLNRFRNAFKAKTGLSISIGKALRLMINKKKRGGDSK